MHSDTTTLPNDSRLRHKAQKLGYELRRARGRLHINNLGGYQIIDPYYNFVVDGADFDLSAEYVEEWLKDCEPGFLARWPV